MLIDLEELQRLQNLTFFEREARKKGFQIVAGIDEAGRGPLAGPVVAAACIFPPNHLLWGVDDSKKLTPKVRCELFEQILSDSLILYGIGIVSAEEIDRINIYQATIQAMQLAISNLPLKPEMLLVDGMALSSQNIPYEKIIGGDAKSQSIAAASIIAKETRDRLMLQYHAEWPDYGFDRHKGYGTALHKEALSRLGPTPIHRHSFEPVRNWQQ